MWPWGTVREEQGGYVWSVESIPEGVLSTQVSFGATRWWRHRGSACSQWHWACPVKRRKSVVGEERRRQGGPVGTVSCVRRFWQARTVVWPLDWTTWRSSMPLIRAVSVNPRRRGSPCLLGEEKWESRQPFWRVWKGKESTWVLVGGRVV